MCLSALALASGGCAEERKPINRVQANALDKTFFVGADLDDPTDNPTFYANGTLLDIGYGAAQDGIFSAFYSNDLSIIRWEITENQLVGRLAYERIDDSDGKGAGLETLDGQVVYAFNIESHFDIQRAYNSSTGEELNVVEENSSDRPWYQRKYMRVDWSRNLITDAYDFDTLAIYGAIFGAYDYQELGFYVSDPTHPYAPNFETDDGYFDVTTRAYASPRTIDVPLFGISGYPACFLDGDFSGGKAPSGNCNPVEVTIRHSFAKVVDTDYEPMDWDGYRFQAAGAFTKERYGFARNYGMTDTQWRRFVSRYNIWERSHYYDDSENMTGAVECNTPATTPIGRDARRDENNDGTHDECESVGNGSQCDIYTQKCTLPYAERPLRPIVWYYTNESDYRYFEPTYWATQEWDIAMRQAVQAARYTECKRLGKDSCDDDFPMIHGGINAVDDTVAVLKEVHACRGGFTNGDWSIESCGGVADDAIAKRGYEGSEARAIRSLVMRDDMVIQCHSPIEANDHPLCAPGKPRLPEGVSAESCQDKSDAQLQATCQKAYTVRIGDVRRHLINVIHAPESPSPWGFGPTYASPLTGEGVSASINVWAWPTDFISQRTVDEARFVAGELSVEEVTEGKFIKDYAAAVANADNGVAMPKLTRSQRVARLDSLYKAATVDLSSGAPTLNILGQKNELPSHAGDLRVVPQMGSGAAIPTSVLEAAKELGKMRQVRASVTAPSTSKQRYIARMEQARGTETEAALINGPMQTLAGVDGLPSSMAQQFASPLRGHINPTLQREMRQLKELGLAERGACLLDANDFVTSPTSTLRFSQILQNKFGEFNRDDSTSAQLDRAENMRDYLAQRMHYSVIAHEMGHTFGLRHNFVSSSNAFNFRPQYWQLRTKNGTVDTVCEDLAVGEEAAANCVGPRYYDPLTQEEREGMIHTWQQSSIMEYAGDITQDLLGLGAYDYNAARMFYADVATVFMDDDLKQGTPLAEGINDSILDTFGGIVGYTYQNAPANFGGSNPGTNGIHYSQLQRDFKLIDNCVTVNENDFRPSWWNEERDGQWDPVADGRLVKVNGEFSRCFQRRVDYVDWDDLSGGAGAGAGVTAQQLGQVGPRVDADGRTRFPYGFATDGWADIGNVAVYRHDNGADSYEIFEFMITEQELRHIFDDYRRDRQTFSVRGAVDRHLGRYNEKIRDGAKGMTLIANNIRNLGLNSSQPLEPTSYFRALVEFWNWGDAMVASSLAFDHFARQMQRPNAGPHADPALAGQFPPPVLDPSMPLTADENATPAEADLVVSNGPQGFWRTVGIGGKPVNNDLADDRGEYDSQFTISAGSYYEKVYTTMLMTESADNFISSSLDDFVDGRFRAVSIADLFPDGYRRWLANNLTNDEWMKGARIAADSSYRVSIDEDGYPTQPLGFTSWWRETPEVCFPQEGTLVCSAYGKDGNPFKAEAPGFTRALSSQVGWEMQKFLIAYTLVYLPENQKQVWMDMLGLWNIGADADPGFANRIELHVPTGDVFVARTYGTEEICFESCKTVQRGIAARILEYANELMAQAYVTTEVVQNGTTWYVPVIQDGKPIVKFDPRVVAVTPEFTGAPPNPNCTNDPDPLDDDYSSFSECTCGHNVACGRLEDFLSIPEYLRDALRDFGMADPSMRGIY